MDGHFNPHHENPFVGDLTRASKEPVGYKFPAVKMANTSSPKRSRRAMLKRVVSVPIGDVEGSKAKGDGAPPSDSWAWRKYGQKPIKGSPYPRGYYRCSTSKGCPARKQVERSLVDPTMLMITYACEHNHSSPVRRSAKITHPDVSKSPSSEKSSIFSGPLDIESSDDRFVELDRDTALLTNDFGWLSDVASSPTVDSLLHSPICTGNSGGDGDVAAMVFPMREEDESLYADLGELPECSVVFRSRFCDREEESRRCSLGPASWCGSTG